MNCGGEYDPLRQVLSETVRDGDYILLVFNDDRQIFTHAVLDKKKCQIKLKVNKRHYNTSTFVGLPYGTVLELKKERDTFEVLPDGEDLMPEVTDDQVYGLLGKSQKNDDVCIQKDGIDNRHLVDSSSNQTITQNQIEELKEKGHRGEALIKTIIANSTTFQDKTDFSKLKYLRRKQRKHQQRCRIIRCTGPSICEALFIKDARRIMSLREDSLAQILSYANVHAGSQVLIFDTCLGIVLGALAQRLGGYGKLLGVFTGQQPHAYYDMLSRFNLSFGELSSISWVHSGEIFASDISCGDIDEGEEDEEKDDRDILAWPCPLQDHTAEYVAGMKTDKEKEDFLAKRSARFARKLTRDTAKENRKLLHSQSDSLIIVSHYDPLPTLQKMLPFLASSCPFVVFSEHLEPLVDCLHALKQDNIAINMRLSDTWMREYQILPDRSHPNMSMSQTGGFILTGIKLDPIQSKNELDEEVLRALRNKVMRGRRHKKAKRDVVESGSKYTINMPPKKRVAKS